MSITNLLYEAGITQRAKRLLVMHCKPDVLLNKICEQSSTYKLLQQHKAAHSCIVEAGLCASSTLSKSDMHSYDLVLVFPSKNKLLTLSHMALAMQALTKHGKIIMACANVHGAKSYEKALKQLAGESASTSKSKCRIFSAYKTEFFDAELAEKWVTAAAVQYVSNLKLYSQPGLFSWDRADVGSQLLLNHLPELFGLGMDLCCGYGLLSVEILKKYQGVDVCHMVDADKSALNCAEKNVQHWADKVKMHWLDASQLEGMPKPLDWVLCNPPFHTGQTQTIELGQDIVKQACRTLKRGGHLYMVANRKLPYEQVLEKHLRSHSALIEQDGFKVIRGIR